jgi:ketosteroid isomerase-like protein
MRDELETLIAAWHDAWFTKDGPAIAQMMTEDYANQSGQT